MELFFLLAVVFSPTILVGVVANLTSKRFAFSARVVAVVISFFANVAAIWFWLSQQNFSKGRVLRLRDRRPPRYARLSRRAGWAVRSPGPNVDISQLPLGRRLLIQTFWLHSARMEHASIVAFGRLAEGLIGLGAPSELVRRSHEAALDEIRHAEAFYGLASDSSKSALSRPWGAGELPALFQNAAPARPRTRDDAIRSLARGSLLDGALAEGVASCVAEAVAGSTSEPSLIALFTMITTDERRHAELAWDVIGFLMALEPETTRAELVRAREELRRSGETRRSAFLDGYSAYGLLPEKTLDALAAAEAQRVTARVDALL